MPDRDFEAIKHKLQKRGFHRDDSYWHECARCKERAVAIYALQGTRVGTRDVQICFACGDARSWSRRGLDGEREEDKTFDLDTFLK